MTTILKHSANGNSSPRTKRSNSLISRTYENNCDSDYTERIDELSKGFDYAHNCEHFWGAPEYSMLYGTPLYEQATSAQRLALNHLYWVGQYNHTANSEANTMLYNQVTTGVFETLGGYQTLCDELNLETDQERHHISAFQKIGYKTKLALFGKEGLRAPAAPKIGRSLALRRLWQPLTAPLETRWAGTSSGTLQDKLLRSATKLLYRHQRQHFSLYLQSKENGPVPMTTGGIAGYTASPSVFKFLTLNWGSSPFMACHYYSMRMVANLSLKAYEQQYYRRFKELSRTGEFVPVPTAVSHYHLLDEAFHTTMSQVISQELYGEFPKPSAYETWLANMIVLRGQQGILGGLSAWLPATFRNDAHFLPALLRLLRSPLFAMSEPEAFKWMERILCQEHDGYHLNARRHADLVAKFQEFFGKFDYLWPVNREMRVMAQGGSIPAAVARNARALRRLQAKATGDLSQAGR